MAHPTPVTDHYFVIGFALVAVLAVAPDGITPAERLSLEPGLMRQLLEVPPSGSVHLAAWPLEPGRSGEVVLTRRDVYAPGASIHVEDGNASREEPRSRLVFLFGEVVGDEATRVLVSVDPLVMRLHGFTRTADGFTELRPLAPDGPDEYLVAPSVGFLDPSMERPGFTCGQPELAEPEPDTRFLPESTPTGIEAVAAVRQATLAVDTDNEFMNLKFANNTTSATNYIASLFALMTVIYERDLQVRVLQGTTFLRVSTTADPLPAKRHRKRGFGQAPGVPELLDGELLGREPRGGHDAFRQAVERQLRVGNRLRQFALQRERRVHVFPGVQVRGEHRIERCAHRRPRERAQLRLPAHALLSHADADRHLLRR